MPAAIIEGEINDGYPWGSLMSESSVTLHVPREKYDGAIALKRTNAQDLSAEQVNGVGVDYVTVAANVTGGEVTISDAQLVDGAWYRFEYADNAVSNPVRLVKGGTDVYRGNAKIHFSGNATCRYNMGKSFHISNDNIMYAVGGHASSAFRKNDFHVAGVVSYNGRTSWASCPWPGYFALGGSSVDAVNLTTVSYNAQTEIQSPKLQSFRVSFQSRNSKSLHFEIVPDVRQNKHISIASDICFGDGQEVAEAADLAA